jgi:gliding motility-associated protein GldM
MAGGKQTPRQAMIGMMYLVLLAMLAMNASKDLLNAFVSLDNGITKTVQSFEKANESFYLTIDKAAASSSAYKPIQAQALAIKQKAAEVVQMMANHRVQLFSAGEVKSTADTAGNEAYRALFENGIALNKDNQDIGGQFYVPGGLPSPDAVALKKVMDEFRDLIVKTIDTDGDEANDFLKDRYLKLFNTEVDINPLELNGPKVTWVSRLAEHIPLAAVAANLTLWQSYVKNAEADVISSIASKMDGSGMVVDQSKGVVQFDNGYVLKNDSVKGKIFLAAYNSKSDPKIYIGSVDTAKFSGNQLTYPPGEKTSPPMLGEFQTVTNVSNGNGYFQEYANEVGAQTVTGVIENKNSKGTFYTKFKSSYMVAEPSATVAAEKMSVFYVGVENPVAVSAPGVAITDIEISAPGLSFKQQKTLGKYIVRPTRATNKKGLDVVVKNKNSGAILGKANFRVKRLPDPAANVLGQKEGLISKGKLKAISKVGAKMENFDFALDVSVQQFTLTVKVGTDLMSFKSKNNKLTPQMRKLLMKVSRGSRIYFEDIRVSMPGGARKVPSLIFKVK